MYEWIHRWVTTWLGRWISKMNLALDFNTISDLHLLDYGFRLNNKVLLWWTLWEISEILLISIHMSNYCAFFILYKNLPLSLHWQTEGDHWSKIFQKLLEVKEAEFLSYKSLYVLYAWTKSIVSALLSGCKFQFSHGKCVDMVNLHFEFEGEALVSNSLLLFLSIIGMI